jgi:uncharacterized membrane-anchored protein
LGHHHVFPDTGTALGDWTADSAGLGYIGSAALFLGLLAAVAAAYFRTRISRTALFWTAFVLTRPLGAVLGDFFDKPRADGGLDLSRYTASGVLLVFIVGCILLFRQRPARRRRSRAHENHEPNFMTATILGGQAPEEDGAVAVYLEQPHEMGNPASH